MIVIGLTGGIGSGKSTVSQFLQKLGATVIDADKVGHEAYMPHTGVWQQVVDAFGRGILQENEEIDRRKLGPIVFADPAALQRLNSIVHPAIYRMIAERLEEMRRKGVKVAVVEAAILIEANWTSLVDQVWMTAVPEDTAVERTVKRSGLSDEQVRARVRSQLSNAERARHADVIIDTNCDLAEVERKVAALWGQLLAESKA
ncbi:MAG: dephospho-CoA kinase [Chloroflexi bacterium]|nr:dephospho-CoA kinase [Chloroflexota bacterium]